MCEELREQGRQMGSRGFQWLRSSTEGRALLDCGWVLTEWWVLTPAGTLEHPLQATYGARGILSHFIIRLTLQGKCHQSYFPPKNPEPQRCLVIHSGASTHLTNFYPAEPPGVQGPILGKLMGRELLI